MAICIICGKFFVKKTGNQIICSNECRNTKIPCAICGKLHKPRSKNNKGEYICSTCEKNLKDDVECIICGKKHKPYAKNDKGEYICKTCHRKSKDDVECAMCGKLHKPNHKNNKGEYICSTCYQNSRDDVKCVICGKKHKPRSKNNKGEYICGNCYLKSKDDVKCAMCGKLHKPHIKNFQGEYICLTCHRKSKDDVECAICGQLCKPIYTNNQDKYICFNCYNVNRLKKNIEYNFKNEKDIDLLINNMKKKFRQPGVYRQIECELCGYGDYNKAMAQAKKRDNYTCQITGKKGDVVVHHLNSYNTHKELACDLNNLITIDKNFHNAYHNKYGYGNNTEEQFWEFVEEWKKGTVTLDDFKEEE